MGIDYALARADCSVSNINNLPNHHQDPFDRMLISQAIDNDLTIITTDSKFSLYKVKLV